MSQYNPIELSPQEIANRLFSEDPKKPMSQMISIDPETDEQLDASLIFEMMITILMEGLETIFVDLKTADLSILDKSLLMKLDPWFWSVGFSLSVDVVDKTDRQAYDTEGRYCKIILNNDDYGFIFRLKNVDKSYHFLINPQYVNGCPLDDINELFADFHINQKVYKIGFKFYQQNMNNRVD
jgi:hypothetical protein